MKILLKIGLVIAGYFAAVLFAFAAVAVMGAPNIPGQDGMSAFGDAILFLAALFVGAVPPTALAIYFIVAYCVFSSRQNTRLDRADG